MEKIVWTNGCFDIIHRGHLELLSFCRSLGGKVIVGLNSDASVRRLKGKNRPINSEKDRAFLLKNLRTVDEVVIFNENTPENLIKLIRPDIIVKGGDYDKSQVVGKEISKVVIFEYVKGYSTTKTLQDIADR